MYLFEKHLVPGEMVDDNTNALQTIVLVKYVFEFIFK